MLYAQRRKEKKKRRWVRQGENVSMRLEPLVRLITRPCAASSRCAPELFAPDKDFTRLAASHQLHRTTLYLKNKHLLRKRASLYLFIFLFFCGRIAAPEGDRWLAETGHVTTVGRPAVSCPLKSSVRGRPQHQTLVSVPPSQFWYICADERKRRTETCRCLFETLLIARSVVNFPSFNTS